MFQVSVGRVGVGNRAELPGMGQAAPGNFHTPSFSRINETASSPVEELAELLAQASEGALCSSCASRNPGYFVPAPRFFLGKRELEHMFWIPAFAGMTHWV
jgi:hypothetical protein